MEHRKASCFFWEILVREAEKQPGCHGIVCGSEPKWPGAHQTYDKMQEIGADLTHGTDSVIHGHQWHLELLQLRMGGVPSWASPRPLTMTSIFWTAGLGLGMAEASMNAREGLTGL